MANMHLVTGYAGQAHVTAADQASLYAALFGSDSFVLNRGNKLAASVISSNTIRIADGDLILQGRHVRLEEGSTADLTIENGAQGYKRNDLIVARYTKDASTGVEEVNLVVIKGTAAESSPTDPEYSNGDIINDHVLQADMPLYRVPLDGINVQNLIPLFSVFGTIKEVTSEAVEDISKSVEDIAETVDNIKIGVEGASEGHIPVFDADGNIVSSGKGLYDFTRAKMTLSGTTLIITTVS